MRRLIIVAFVLVLFAAPLIVKASTDGLGNYYWSWDSTTVKNGTHVITIRTTDNAGNVSEHSHTVTVRNKGKKGR